MGEAAAKVIGGGGSLFPVFLADGTEGVDGIVILAGLQECASGIKQAGVAISGRLRGGLIGCGGFGVFTEEIQVLGPPGAATAGRQVGGCAVEAVVAMLLVTAWRRGGVAGAALRL